jgi:diadenosine tetraphosphatase ApaH/serine/threonine PP2A family protein phosphatase
VRVAVVSDIHANLPALEAILGAVGDAHDGLWVLGDTVGYGAEPDAVVTRLREAGAVAVRGNHDHVAAGGEGADWFNPTARHAIAWTARTISPTTRDWLAQLPLTRKEDGYSLVHGSPRDPLWEYVDGPDVARGVLAEVTVERTLYGHTHVPRAYLGVGDEVAVIDGRDGLVLELDERRLLANPGSVGQPRDGDPRASFLWLDLGRAIITWTRVVYDIATAAARIRAAGLPDRLAARLSLGV